MGCVTSKPKQCPHCRNSITQRSNSLHQHRSPPRRSDGHRVLAFSSSSLKLDNKIYTAAVESKNNEVAMGLIEAKTWSNMINHKIPKIAPKTPITTPPGEPETINVWEVMEGLDDISPFRPTCRPRSFSFDVSLEQGISNSNSNSNSNSSSKEINDSSTSPKPFRIEPTDLDPEVISSFRKSLKELPPEDPFQLRSPETEKVAGDRIEEKKREKVVIYFTSLRGVRKTYEDCCEVRMILKSMGVRVDERDMSMDSGFKQELKKLIGEKFNGGGLPRVFVGELYIGGAEEIRQMHEDGELEKVLEGCEKVEEGGGGDGGGGGGCEVCGEVRFVPCERCCGSCKIYCEEEEDDDDDDDEEEEEEEEEEGGFQRCPDCNENGLIRCPICCS